MRDAFVKPLVGWFREAGRDLPWRHTADPYAIWVSEIMLQQTRVETVKTYYERFLRELPDVYALAACPADRLLKLFEGLGYYSRARNMKRAAERIVEQGGAFPSSAGELRALPGIGAYTAGAIASIAFGEPEPAVDGNVLRVYARLTALGENILLASVRRKAEDDLRAVLQDTVRDGEVRAGECTEALIELGALVRGAAPHCGLCPVADACEAKRLGLVSVLPVREKEKARRVEERTVFLVRDGGRVAIRKREADGLLAGLYEFPNLPGYLDREAALEYIGQQGFRVLEIRELSPARHLFTHVEWALKIYEVRIAPHTGENGWIFAGRRDLEERYPIPSAFSACMRHLSIKGSGRH